MTDRAQLKEKRLAAFEIVVAAYETPLLRYASRFLQNRHGAQDVVQNTFLRLLDGWRGEWTPSPQMATWLYRVAHNCAVDYIRKESRRENLHQRHAEDVQDAIPPDRGVTSLVSDEALRAMAALKTVSEREQQLVILKVFEEKSYKEIAEITGLTVSNVGYILHNAMKKMAACLREDDSNVPKPAATRISP